MKNLTLIVLKLICIWPSPTHSETLHFIEEIVKAKPIESLAICGKLFQDVEQDMIIEILQKYKMSFMQKNCSNLNDVDKTVIIFNKPRIQEFRPTFKKLGVQNSLAKNIWIIISEKPINSIENYFSQSRLKIGINANLFVILQSNLGQELVQIIGKGTSNFEIIVIFSFMDLLKSNYRIFNLQEHGLIDQVNVGPILETTAIKKDFQGIPFKINYANRFKPYCWTDEDGKVQGMFEKALKIASSVLNLTLVMQETRIENRNIWSKK